MKALDIPRRLFLGSAVGALALRPSRIAQADTAFTDFSFAATGSTFPRTMPDRLSDVVNVKDWGALGNGSANDAPAIQKAIDFAISRGGGKVVFPPGNYILSSPLEIGSNTVDVPVMLVGIGAYGQAGIGCSISYTGANFILSKGSRTNDCLAWVEGFNLANGSTSAGAGCVKLTRSLVGVRQCSINGNVCVDASAAIGATIIDIWASGLSSNDDASFATWSGVCFYLGQTCTAMSCRCVGGYLIAYALSGSGPSCIGCSAEGGATGVRVGWGPSGETAADSCTIQGFQTEAVNTPIDLYNATACLVQGNMITGTVSALHGVSISGVSVNGSNLVTVTSSAPHDLPIGTPTRVFLFVNNPAFKETWFQIVTATDPTHFTYQLSSNPGTWTGGSWQYPLLYSIRFRICTDCVVMGMEAGIKAAIAGVDLDYDGNAQHINNVMFGVVSDTSGWKLPTNRGNLAGWKFIQCGAITGGDSQQINSEFGSTRTPTGVMVFADLPGQGTAYQWGPIEGQEYDIIDGAKAGGGAAAFGDNLQGGGSGHYKARYNGTNWQRVG